MAKAYPTGFSTKNDNLSARDFVLKRLQNAESPVRPAELADEYGCTNGHIRNVLGDLRNEDRVVRVDRGLYADSDSDFDAETTDYPAPDVDDADSEADTDFSEREDGPVQSNDKTGRAGDQEGNEMVSDRELQIQRGLVTDDEGDDEDEDDDEDDDHAEPVAQAGSTTTGLAIPKSFLYAGVILGLGLLLYIRFQTSSSPSQQQTQGEQPRTDRDLNELTESIEGGLI